MLTSEESKSEEPEQSLTEHSRFASLIYPLKLILFPFRALREMANNQSLRNMLPGLVLVIVLDVVVSASTAYTRASKIFLDSETQSTSLLGADFIGATLLPTLLQNLLGLIISWVAYSGILFLLAKFFGKKSISFNIFLTIVGYTFSVLVIYGAVAGLLASFLPEIHFEASVWQSGTPEEIGNIYYAVWGTTLAYKLADYLGLVFMFWIVFLGALVVRVFNETSLIMAIALSFAAYFAGNMLTAFVSLLI